MNRNDVHIINETRMTFPISLQGSLIYIIYSISRDLRDLVKIVNYILNL